MPEFLEEIEEDCESLCLYALFESLNGNGEGNSVETKYGYEIRRESAPDGSFYYDLVNSSGLRLCCDGEECIVIDRTENYISLIDVLNFEDENAEELEEAGINPVFRLTEKEFAAATHGAGGYMSIMQSQVHATSARTTAENCTMSTESKRRNMETQQIKWTEVQKGSFAKIMCKHPQEMFSTETELEDGTYICFLEAQSRYSMSKVESFLVEKGRLMNTHAIYPNLVTKFARIK